MRGDLIERFAVLRELLTFSRPMRDVSIELSRFDWDFDGEGMKLEQKHVANVLRGYIDHRLSDSDVETWANLIESREDIYADPLHEESLNEIIYDLANPILTRPLDMKLANLFIEQLECK